LMAAPTEDIRCRMSYNLAAMTFSPAELFAEIQRLIPGARIDYQPDFRQAIAASWSESIDDSAARRDWDWAPAYDLSRMTREMIAHISTP
ncbi:MAG: NAD-dependent epimerase, partial [Bacteroidota bacterium]